MFISVRNNNKIFKTIFRPIGNGRKWTFFIVNSIPLVNQQASNLRRHLPWDVGTFSAESSYRKQWDEELNKYQVINRIIYKKFMVKFFLSKTSF